MKNEVALILLFRRANVLFFLTSVTQVSICNRVWELMPHKVHGHSFTHVSRYHKIWKVGGFSSNLFPFTFFLFKWLSFLATVQDGKQTVPAKEISCKEEVNDISGLNKALKYFDENFFNDSQVC